MKIFNLPDLGEGLAEAEIHQWHIKEGDTVTMDQIIVSVETAKAIVDVPSPVDGKIKKLFGEAGTVIKTGAPFIGFEDDTNQAVDNGTVAGHIETGSAIIVENPLGVNPHKAAPTAIKAIPAIRALARKLDIDLAAIIPTGANGQITVADVEAAAQHQPTVKPDYVPLRGVRRAMAQAMAQSHAEVVPITVFDNADIQHLAEGSDITVRLIEALIHACNAEPALNAWYDSQSMSRKLHSTINIGIAVDTPEGLFVPVIKHAEKLSGQELRTAINQFKLQAASRSFTPEALKDPTILLSNFGTFAGRYATPIVVPPSVAILGTGRIYEEVKMVNSSIAVHRMLPLSLTFDHRSVTGGEATRFLGQLMSNLGNS